MHRYLVLLGKLLAASSAIALFSVFPSASYSQDPQSLFNDGRREVLSNCGDCEGASEAGLLAGLKKVTSAIDAGYSDKPAAYRVLATGYGTLAFAFHAHHRQNQLDALARQREVYEQLIKLDDSDGDTWFRYAQNLAAVRRHEDEYRALSQAVAHSPLHPDAPFALAIRLAERGDSVGARDLFIQSVERADQARVSLYRDEIIAIISKRREHTIIGQINKATDERLAALRIKKVERN